MTGFYLNVTFNTILIINMIFLTRGISYDELIEVVTFRRDITQIPVHPVIALVTAMTINIPVVYLILVPFRLQEVMQAMGKPGILYLIMPLLTLIALLYKLKKLKEEA